MTDYRRVKMQIKAFNAQIDGQDWQELAACRKVPLDKNPFEAPNVRAAHQVAAKYCQDCPVMAECVRWAKADRYVGVAGGRLWSLSPTTGKHLYVSLTKRK